MKTLRILLATGGSGGHIFPALLTALVLKDRGHEVYFAGALAIAQEQIEKAGFRCHNVGSVGFQDRSLSGLVRFCVSMVWAFGQSLSILRRVRPDKILGFGGYGSFPLVLAGFLLRYPTMIHEQNVLPGKANRLLAKLVQKIAVSFKDSIRYFGKNKSVWTGCPCHDQATRRSREDICRSFGLKTEGKIIAVLGGSQGSQKLNEVFFQAVVEITGAQAWHMTGKKEYELYAQKYQEAKLPVVVAAFISPIEELYAVADVVITRAGAATVSELGAYALPAILVPYPFAANHQRHNAMILVKAGAALLIEQKDLTVASLREAIAKMAGGEFSRERMAGKIKGLFPQGADARLADAVENL